MNTPVYYFTVVLAGFGDTPEEAWQDAVEGFVQDPGETPQVLEVYYDEEGADEVASPGGESE